MSHRKKDILDLSLQIRKKFEQCLEVFVRKQRGFEKAKVMRLQKMPGGASKETWAFDLHATDASSDEVLPLVLRIELIRGICILLETDVVPALQEPLRFHTRVAANLLKIIERELELGDGHLLSEGERLRQLLGSAPSSAHSRDELRAEILTLNEQLSTFIRSGEADRDPQNRKIMDHIERTLIEKLEIANPGIITTAQSKS